MDGRAFVPRQAIAKDSDLYSEITANSTRDVANGIIEILPPLLAQFRIHDNGCGKGEVTGALMATGPPQGIHIEATDNDQTYLDRLKATVRDKQWPATVSNMAAEHLTFPDESFDLSIANFVVFLTPEGGVPALQHMRRTLKPGGAAVLTSWARLPQAQPAKVAHLETRGPDAPPLREIPPEWWLGSHLRHVATQAGFAEEKTELHSVSVDVHYDSAERLAWLIWSWLGPPLTGWLETDSDKWDEAIAVILRSFEETDGFEVGPDGVKVKLTANVLIARK